MRSDTGERVTELTCFLLAVSCSILDGESSLGDAKDDTGLSSACAPRSPALPRGSCVILTQPTTEGVNLLRYRNSFSTQLLSQQLGCSTPQLHLSNPSAPRLLPRKQPPVPASLYASCFTTPLSHTTEFSHRAGAPPFAPPQEQGPPNCASFLPPSQRSPTQTSTPVPPNHRTRPSPHLPPSSTEPPVDLYAKFTRGPAGDRLPPPPSACEASPLAFHFRPGSGVERGGSSS